MLSFGGFPPPPCNAAPQKPTSQSLPIPMKTYQTHLFFVSNAPTHHSFSPILGLIRTNFGVSAVKTRRKGGNSVLEVEGFSDEDEDEDDYEEDEEEEIEDEDEDEEVFIPLKNMKKWAKNKPSGFGEGKEYDTSIEDNLLDEMEQSRQAQLANINQLKIDPESSNSKKGTLHKQKAPEVVPTGIRVRLVNLPKKRNIHRDLQLAFKGIPGIVNIIPAVSGNKKTRDPTCKGFAFVDLKSEEDANRFVQMFSRQSISFGKIQKRIRFEMMTSKSTRSVYRESANGNYSAPRLVEHCLGEVSDTDFDVDNTSLDSWEQVGSDESESAHVYVSADLNNGTENLGSISLGTTTESAFASIPLNQEEKVPANEKKQEPKRKRIKVPKLNIPGSANRLRIKEKNVLTGVLSKYAVQPGSASKEQT
ncbi:uncharacterized protein LOC130779959 [Actinidia eriantha]|uniref:uncharacterized protein LOC130779959 n=1 Tax=Actinidia eriantha TaxID=165200 RepID=UPI002589FAFC|nr:uncharacterized protein LOC130779959 [Actinidia eriantha]